MAKKISKSSRTRSAAPGGRRSTSRRGSRSRRTSAQPVRVRMYRHGLGDCFLVTFRIGNDAKHMLIDCGTLGATSTPVTMEEVVNDIRKTTGSHLDVLVATHEHKDHVSGFRSLRGEFEEMD